MEKLLMTIWRYLRKKDFAKPITVEIDTNNKLIDPDQAWKALSLVNDWIKHAETKVGATLAAAGVTGGVLFNLVKDKHDSGFWFNLSASLCAAMVGLAGVSTIVALLPTLKFEKKEDPTSPLFFEHISRAHSGNAATYIEILHALTGDRDQLTRHIAHQVHANSKVASRKYKWATRGIWALGIALVLLFLIAIQIGIRGA